jgi:hypothetical protein
MSGPTGFQGTQGTQGMYIDPFQQYMPTINVNPMEPSQAVLSMFPSAATGPVEPPHIATLEELMASHSAIIAKEAKDTESLGPLVSPSRDAFRPQLFQWATVGFPDLYVVQSFTITPPAICADGVTREIGKYIEYCIEKNLGEVIDGLKALMTGIQPSWSMSGSTLQIHVTRI